jgi:hypothetical protein
VTGSACRSAADVARRLLGQAPPGGDGPSRRAGARRNRAFAARRAARWGRCRTTLAAAPHRRTGGIDDKPETCRSYGCARPDIVSIPCCFPARRLIWAPLADGV